MIKENFKLNRENSILVRNARECKIIKGVLTKFTKEHASFYASNSMGTSYIYYNENYNAWVLRNEPKINTTVIDLNSIKDELYDIAFIVLLDEMEELL